MAKRLQADVIARRPDVVIWQTGSNDPLRHVPLDRFEAETRAGVAAMRKAGIEVILMEPQWCPRLETLVASAAYRDAIRRIGLENHVDVVRRSDLMHDWIREGRLTATPDVGIRWASHDGWRPTRCSRGRSRQRF